MNGKTGCQTITAREKATYMIHVFFSVVFLFVGIVAFAQNTDIDRAISSTGEYLNGNIRSGSNLLFLDYYAPNEKLSYYITDELVEYIVNLNNFRIVDRKNMEAIDKEIVFQLSGEVSDESALSIGKKYGAQFIIIGEFVQISDAFRLSTRIINIETTEIQGQRSFSISPNAKLMDLLTDDGSLKYLRKLDAINIGFTPGIYFETYNNEYQVRSILCTFGMSLNAYSFGADKSIGMFSDFSMVFPLTVGALLNGEQYSVPLNRYELNMMFDLIIGPAYRKILYTN